MKHGDEDQLRAPVRCLSASIARFTEHGEQETTAVAGLSLYRRDEPSDPVTGLYEPSICVVAQGAKRVVVGQESFVYDAHHYLLTSVDLPAVVQVIQASDNKPYLGLRLMLDLRDVSQLMLDSALPAPRRQQTRLAMVTGEITLPLLNAIQRLVDLLANEEDIPILAPTIKREITYRLLVGDQGARLRQVATIGSQSQQIARAIDWLKGNYTRHCSIDVLAGHANMSPSTFHHHFKLVTSLSPLQYQKDLRLREARRLMLVERMDATTAAFEVGYESPSQFNREYSRLFGQPPLRDITSLRRMAAGRR